MNDKEYQDFKKSVVDFIWNELDPEVEKIEATNHIAWEELFPKIRPTGLF